VETLAVTLKREGFSFRRNRSTRSKKRATEKANQKITEEMLLYLEFIWNYFYLCRAVLHAGPDALWRVCCTGLAAARPWRLSARMARDLFALHNGARSPQAQTEHAPDAANTVTGKTVAIALIQCP
jgi:hypothetical protein